MNWKVEQMLWKAEDMIEDVVGRKNEIKLLLKRFELRLRVMLKRRLAILPELLILQSLPELLKKAILVIQKPLVNKQIKLYFKYRHQDRYKTYVDYSRKHDVSVSSKFKYVANVKHGYLNNNRDSIKAKSKS